MKVERALFECMVTATVCIFDPGLVSWKIMIMVHNLLDELKKDHKEIWDQQFYGDMHVFTVVAGILQNITNFKTKEEAVQAAANALAAYRNLTPQVMEFIKLILLDYDFMVGEGIFNDPLPSKQEVFNQLFPRQTAKAEPIIKEGPNQFPTIGKG